MRVVASLLGLLLLVVGCGVGLSGRPTPSSESADKPTSQFESVALTKEPPRQLPGVDTSALDGERKQIFWDLSSRLYAPCTEHAVTLVQCIEESRPCGGCLPMANVLSDLVKRGTARANAAAAVTGRFGPEGVKTIPLRGSPTKGPANAPVTIVVFSDFECPACAAAVPLLSEVAAKHPKDVRLVHKYFPLPKHLRARYAAKAAYAAQKQGKYWEMEKLIFENQTALSDEDLEKYAQKVGLDMVRYRADKDSKEAEEVIEQDIQDGDAAELRHTPFVLINGRLFDPKYFRYDTDLEPWIVMEKGLVGAK